MAAPDFMLFVPEDWDTATPDTGSITLDAGSANVDFAFSGIQLPGSTTQQGALSHDISAQAYTECWVAANVRVIANGEDELFRLSGATDPFLRILVLNTSEHWKVQRWTGAWTDVGATITAPTLSNTVRLDIRLSVADAGGEIQVYANRLLVATFTGDTKPGTDTTINTIAWEGVGTIVTTYAVVGGCMVDGADTRKLYLVENPTLTMQSTDTGGTESTIDEYIGSNSNTDFINFDAANEEVILSFNVFDAAITDDWTVEHVSVFSAQQALADPAFYFRGRCEIAATKYDSTNWHLPVAAYESYARLDFPNNPATAAPWLNKSAVDAAYFGIQAKTTV